MKPVSRLRLSKITTISFTIRRSLCVLLLSPTSKTQLTNINTKIIGPTITNTIFKCHFTKHEHTHELAGKVPRCWSCSKIVEGGASLFCNGCNIVQPLSPNQTFFSIFGFPDTFDIDAKLLQEKYKALQRKFHPDTLRSKSKEEQVTSTNNSAAINHAYNVLKTPHLRAQYLLSLCGIELEEGTTITDPELLMEIMEIREKIEESSQRETIQIGKQNHDSIKDTIHRISQAFRRKDLEAAKLETTKLQYLIRIQEAVENKLGAVIETDH
mmetsp:Transcript_19023/g.26610  ORF Transcript_19023/g.26610 Transcript_19023/m.26610 type:complete len:269 (-) Transcript_19023:3078-3884(-)